MVWDITDFVVGTPAYDVLARREASDIILIRFMVDTDCRSSEVTVQSIGAAKDVCQQALNFTEDAKTLITDVPELAIEKSGWNITKADPIGDLIYAGAGDSVAWQINVTNIGDQHVTNLFVTDTVPGNFTITDISAGGNISGDTASWGALGGLLLDVDETKTFIVTGTIENGVCALSNQNTAFTSFGCSTSDVCPGTLVSANAILQTQPVITNTQSSGDLYNCGGEITIVFENEGPPAVDMVLTDTLPAEYVYESTIFSSIAPSTYPSEGDNPAVWSWLGANQVPTGTTTLVFSVKHADLLGACTDPPLFVPNRLDINYDDTCTDTGPFSDTVTNTIQVAHPHLVMDKSPYKQFKDSAGEVNWTLQVSNLGDGPATRVLITDVLGSAYTAIQASNGQISGGGGNSPIIVGNVITWTPEITIPAGSTWSAVITATIEATGTNRNDASARGSCSTGCIYATLSDFADVTLLRNFAKLPPLQTETIGADVTFYLSDIILSDEDIVYEDLILTDSLPVGLGYLSSVFTYTYDMDGSQGGPYTVTLTNPSTAPLTGQSGPIIWSLGDISGTISVNAVITAVIQNIAPNQDGVSLINVLDMYYIHDSVVYAVTDQALVKYPGAFAGN